MANFLDDISIYNAKAALAISNAVAEGNTQKANMMSSLKTTANDETLTEAVRLNALTALINLGCLLDIPLPPYFPLAVSYGNILSYQGVHNDLTGLQGGANGEYYHLTLAEKIDILSKANLSDITFANLLGVYTDNPGLAAVIDSKQPQLSGNGFVTISGTTISYDPSVYLTSINGIAAGGELTGTYPNPALDNNAVISKVLTGWSGSVSPAVITASDSILTALQKLNANINNVINNPSGVTAVSLTNNASSVFTTTPVAASGNVVLDVSLNTQNANLFLASDVALSGQVPAFRAIGVADLPASTVTPGQYGTATDIPVITVDAKGRVTDLQTIASTSGGQVNSVVMTTPAGTLFTAVNSGTAVDPIVGFTLGTESANTVWAGPTTGAAATPGFRSLVYDDIASISIPITQITNLQQTLDNYLPKTLATDMMYVGNTSGAAVNAIATGDLSLVYVNNNGTNEAEFTLNNGVVTYPKIQDVTSQTVLGRYSLTNGQVQELTFNPLYFSINSSSGEIGLVSPIAPILTAKGDLLTYTGAALTKLSVGANATLLMADSSTTTGLKWAAMSGDATIATSGAITIANNAVTFAKMQTIADLTVLGNDSGGSAVPSALSRTQLTALNNQFTSTLQGVVPPSGGGTTNFLRADGNWAAITGTGTVLDVSVATANGFTGSVATSTTTPVITIALNSITGMMLGTGSGVAVAGMGTDYVAPGNITAASGAGSGLQVTGQALLGRGAVGTGKINAISLHGSLAWITSTSIGINPYYTNQFLVVQEMPKLRLNSAGTTMTFEVSSGSGTFSYVLPPLPPSGGNYFLSSSDVGFMSWQEPAGSGTTTNAVTFNSSGSGASSGATFDGSSAITVSYNTIGAQLANANLTGLSSLTYVTGTPFVKMTAAGTFTLDTNTYVGGTATQYAVLVGGAGNTVASITPVTSNKLLVSNGVSSNPGWTDATYPVSIVSGGILYGSGTNAVGQIAAPTTSNTFLKWDGTAFTWATTGGGSGTVTSVGLQVPAFLSVTNSPITGAGDITIGLSGTALPITSGGTGGVTAITARANILPAYTANYILGVNSGATDVEWVSVTGTGSVVRANTPTLITPVLGAATATSINGLTITATTGTLTLANGSTLATSGAFSTTLTATGATNVTLPTTGTLATLAGTELFTNKTINSPIIGNGVGQGHLHLHTINNNPPLSPSADYITIFADDSPKRFGFQFGLDGFESYFEFAAASTSKTYTFPNASGTVALIDNTQTLTIPASGGTSGDIALGVSGGGTVSLLAPATVTGAGVYTLPNAYPTGASQYLTATTGGVMSWVTIAAGGDVVGPSSSTDGNFAVFNSTTGKIIMESSVASLGASPSGRATFNNGVDVGVSSSTTGTLVFRNGTTSATTTLQASTSQSANLIYTWPSAAPAAGNILSSDASGNLSWTAAGAGNMVLATAGQVVTGSKIFSDTTLLLRSSAGTAFYTTLSAGNTSANYTATFPAASGTVPLLSFAQTFTAAQTFQAGIALNTAGTFTTSAAVASTFSGAASFSASAASAASVTINNGANSSLTNPQLSITSSGVNSTQWMSFGSGSVAPPASSTRSIGTKVVLYNSIATGLDTAIGVESGGLWLSGGTNAVVRFYPNNSTVSSGQFDYSSTVRGLNLTATSDTNSTIPAIVFSGATTSAQFIQFTSAVGPVTLTTARSIGTKLVLNNSFLAGSQLDTAIGVRSGALWLCTAGTAVEFFVNNSITARATIDTSGFNLVTGSTYRINATQVVQARVTGWGTPTGTISRAAFTTTASANYIQAELNATIQALKAVITDLQTHGLIGA